MLDLGSIQPVTARDILVLFDSVPSKGQLMKLCELKIIKPYREASGTGSNRLFDWYNLIEIAIWRELHLVSASHGSIRTVLEELKKDGFREKALAEDCDFVVFGMALGGMMDPADPRRKSTANRSWVVDTLSSQGLSSSISQGGLFSLTNPPESAAIPYSAFVVDLREIKKRLSHYFEVTSTHTWYLPRVPK